MDVKLALSQMIGQQANTLNELSEKDLVYKQKLCMEILGVANVISPGNTKKLRSFCKALVSIHYAKPIFFNVYKYCRYI